MPPKKTRRGFSLKPITGRARKYIEQNYSQLPPTPAELKNGHLLFLYYVHEKSAAKTVRAVQEQLQCRVLPCHLRSMVKRAEKYHNLSRESDMNKFSEVCEKGFDQFSTVLEEPDWTRPLDPVSSDDEPIIVSCTPPIIQRNQVPGPFGFEIRSPTRNLPLSLRELKLKSRLDFVSLKSAETKKRNMEVIRALKAKLRDPKLLWTKSLTQELKRKKLMLKKKDAKIQLLHAKYSTSSLAMELREMKDKLKWLRKSHNRLKKSRKEKNLPQAVAILMRMHEENRQKENLIHQLEYENLCLEGRINDIKEPEPYLTKEGHQYTTNMRMLVYDSLVNNVPTHNIPTLLTQFVKRLGIDIGDVPCRNTAEMMCRELGAITDFQAAESMLENGKDLTIGFDATTQEGVQVNSIHVTSTETCHVIAVDPLVGGTSEDYENHIHDALDNLSEVYCAFHDVDNIKDNPKADFPTVRSGLVDSISSSMTDRAAVNHATITRLENSWGKKLNELNCHLHPLEAIARTCRKALQSKEPENTVRMVKGAECLASGLVYGFSKFRYKDATGDPKGFVLALTEAGLPRGLLPRYRGNRLHIMFAICARLFEHQDFFKGFLKRKTSRCSELKDALLHDLDSPTAMIEIQVLGLLGKLLTGPWMSMFYKRADSGVSFTQGIEIVKDVLARVEDIMQDPGQTLCTTHDFLGNELSKTCEVQALLVEPQDKALFIDMMEACLIGVCDVLKRQYMRFFELDISQQLQQETESARLHNIDAEQVMGMFSALKDKAPNATLCFISCKIRAQKNNVMGYLDGLAPEKRERLIKVAMSLARKQRQRRRKKAVQLQGKNQKRDENVRKKLETKLKKGTLDYSADFPEMDEDRRLVVEEILGGRIVGRRICHSWLKEDQTEILYLGQINKYTKKKNGMYKIGYWLEGENYEDDATDYEMSQYQLAADFLLGDLSLS